MGKTPVMLLILGVLVAVILLFLYTNKQKRKEKFFSRDLTYNRANSVLWDRYFKKGAIGVANQDALIKSVYKYPGYGDYTGMMCQGPNNFRCTTYNTIK